MTFQLILAEKPSVARDIARALGIRSGRGQGYIDGGETRVSWCLGHLAELAEPQAYNPDWKRWSLKTLPMLPEAFTLKARGGGKDQWKVVKELLRHKDLGQVINACDAGREGELIFAYVYQLAGCKAPVQRLWISSMTEGAIRGGFQRLRDGEQLKPLEDAARCRSEADWLLGLNATRAMTLRVRGDDDGSLLSLGRVQTPVLAMLVDRDAEIDAFEPKDFWQIKAQLGAEAGAWEASWTGTDPEGGSIDRLFEQEKAEALRLKVHEGEGQVVRVERKETRKPPPLLYDLTALQREANGRFGLSAKRTLELLQGLYERHKVLTYPRTDSRHIGADQVPGLPALLESLRFGPYQAASDQVLQRWPVKLGKRVVDDTEVSDHHAILPTGQDPRSCGLSVEEKRLFDLVARRFIAVFMPPARFAQARIDALVNDETLTAKGQQRLDPGWQTIDPPRSKKDSKDVLLPPVNEGDAVRVLDTRLHEGRTRPPRRFNDASLLAAMENAGKKVDDAELRRAMKRSGLGTPATRAAIIETILQRTFAERRGREVHATDLGRALIEALPVEQLRSPRMTGAWEARLVAVAEGNESRERFMHDVREFAAEAVEAIRGMQPEAALRERLGVRKGPQGDELAPCPRCEGVVCQARFGWRCTHCEVRIPGKVARRDVSTRMAKALLKDGATRPMKGFRSKEGKEFSAALVLDPQGKVVFSFPEPDSLGDCPACAAPVRSRRTVFTCDTGRECPFVVFEEMSGHTVTQADVEALLNHGRSALIEDFTTRDGQSFVGALMWVDGRVRAQRIDPRSEQGAAGACPDCSGQVAFRGGSWRCGGCAFTMPGEVAGRPVRPQEAAILLRDGLTPRLHGFRQRDGAVFKAGLVRGESGRLSLDFKAEKGSRQAPAGGPAPAFEEVVDCPRCVAAGSLDPGYVVAGRAAWGCSQWRQGCGLRLPFVIEGVTLEQDQARRFFSKSRATRYQKGFTGALAAGRSCRVAFEPEQPPHWRLEPKSRR